MRFGADLFGISFRPRKNSRTGRLQLHYFYGTNLFDLAREFDAKRRRLISCLGLGAVVIAVTLFLSRDAPNAEAPGIIVLATGYTNGEQLVTFRPEPRNAEVTHLDVVSVADDGKVQPSTIRNFGNALPIRNGMGDQSDPSPCCATDAPSKLGGQVAELYAGQLHCGVYS